MTAQHPEAVPFFPEASGLFDPKREYDACGVGFIADLKGGASHRLIKDALAFSRTSSTAVRSGPIR